MAKARVKLVCVKCGQEFWAEKTCYNRSEANNWEEYMERVGGTCKECWIKEKEAEREAKKAEFSRAAAEGAQGLPFELPALTGSEKQVKWANDLRNGVIATLNNHKIKWEEFLETAKTDEEVKAELDRIMNPSAKWWIDNRRTRVMDVAVIGERQL